MTNDARAKIVREALKHIATETTSPKIMTAALSLATAGDAVLAKLGRLVR